MYPSISGHGIVFVISQTKELPNSLPNEYFGLFNNSNIGSSSNHVFGVELDTRQDFQFDDINDLKSANSTPAGYYDDNAQFRNLSLSNGYPIQVWIEYDGVKKKIDVTLAPMSVGASTNKLGWKKKYIQGEIGCHTNIGSNKNPLKTTPK
jgi:hypothetical protein